MDWAGNTHRMGAATSKEDKRIVIREYRQERERLRRLFNYTHDDVLRLCLKVGKKHPLKSVAPAMRHFCKLRQWYR